MGKKTDTQLLFKRVKTLTKRVGTITVAAALALSVPSIANVVNLVSPGNSLQVPVGYAQSSNLLVVNENETDFTISEDKADHTLIYHFQLSGNMVANEDPFDLTDLTYVFKFPEQLSYLFEDQSVLDSILGLASEKDTFSIVGNANDINGEHVSLDNEKYEAHKYIGVNNDTNSIEFDLGQFYIDNDLQPSMTKNEDGTYIFNHLKFNIPIRVSKANMIEKGSYTFKTAIVRGKSFDISHVETPHIEYLISDDSNDLESDEEVAIEKTHVEEPLKRLSSTDEKSDINDDLADEEIAPEQEDSEWDEELDDHIDKSLLAERIREADGYLREYYTGDSFNALKASIREAKVVLQSEDATNEVISAALDSLEKAIEGLTEKEVEPLETDDLVALIKKAKTFNAKDYTEESFLKLTQIIEVAENNLKNEEVDQERINAAVRTLQNTIDTLIKIENSEKQQDESPEPSSESNKDTDKGINKAAKAAQQAINNLDTQKSSVAHTEENNGGALPKTATSTYNILLIGLIAFIAGGLNLIFRRNKKIN